MDKNGNRKIIKNINASIKIEKYFFLIQSSKI